MATQCSHLERKKTQNRPTVSPESQRKNIQNKTPGKNMLQKSFMFQFSLQNLKKNCKPKKQLENLKKESKQKNGTRKISIYLSIHKSKQKKRKKKKIYNYIYNNLQTKNKKPTSNVQLCPCPSWLSPASACPCRRCSGGRPPSGAWKAAKNGWGQRGKTGEKRRKTQKNKKKPGKNEEKPKKREKRRKNTGKTIESLEKRVGKREKPRKNRGKRSKA